MRVQAAGVSLQGRRKKNEDSLGLFPEWNVYAIADGLGGLQFGERASAGAIAGVAQEGPAFARCADALRELPSTESRRALFDQMELLFERTSGELHAMVKRDRVPMGTTLSSLVVAGDRMIVGHVGDSRIYRVRAGRAGILTTDHSVAATRLRAGLITLEEYYKSNQRNVLTQSLGPAPQVDPDVVEAELQNGDTIVLCTDGVWGRLQPAKLAQIAAEGSPEEAAQQLAANAIAFGSTDNCTAVVIRIVDVGPNSGVVPFPRALAQSRLFRDFSEVDLGLLAPFVTHIDVPAGTTLIREGDGGEDMFLIERGLVVVSRQGRRLAELGPGAHFGEIPLPIERPRTTSVTTAEPTRLLRLSRREFDVLCARRPVLAIRVTRRLMVDLATQLVDARGGPEPELPTISPELLDPPPTGLEGD
jgi:PPM family protein phosphatase